MAGEAIISAQIVLDKGNVHIPAFGIMGLPVDVSGSRYVKQIQLIGITQEAIGMGEIAAPGFSVWINRDPTNAIQLRRATGEGAMVRLKPGEVAMFRLEATAPFAIALVASCYLEYLILEA